MRGEERDKDVQSDLGGSGNGGCEHRCMILGSDVLCYCLPGYRLAEDARSCLGTRWSQWL